MNSWWAGRDSRAHHLSLTRTMNKHPKTLTNVVLLGVAFAQTPLISAPAEAGLCTSNGCTTQIPGVPGTKIPTREYGTYGGFVSTEETRFLGYVSDFIDEFGNDDQGATDFDHNTSVFSWMFKLTHYEYATCDQLLGATSMSGVNSVDIAYLAGHGNSSSINMSGQSCNLTAASWGPFSNYGTGATEHVVLHSCKVLEMDAAWRDRWQRSSLWDTKPFSGLHTAMGFRTNHTDGLGAGAWASDSFAENLEDGQSIRTAWYDAVEDGYWLSPYAVVVKDNNKQAVFYVPPFRDESMNVYTRSIYTTTQPGSINFGHPDYALWGYYRN